jgi:hypothetical protein
MRRSAGRTPVLASVRYLLPLTVVAAGIVAVVLGGFSVVSLEGAAQLVGAGLSILLLNVLIRIGISGDEDREAEDAAREFFTQHGHWPDEEPGRRPVGGAPSRLTEDAAAPRS